MFSEVPFFKLFLIYSIGIILSVFFVVDVGVLLVSFSFFLLLIFHFLTQKNHRLIPYFGVFVLFFILETGVFRASEFKSRAKITNISQKGFVIGRIIKSPKIYDKFVKTNLEIIAVRDNKSFQESQGKVLLMLEKDSTAQTLKKGDIIQFEPQFKEIESNKNPETFNYKRYLFFHLISQQTYLKSNKWIKISVQKSILDMDRISDLRNYLLQKYKEYGIEGQELSVLSALSLGYKNDLDSRIQKSYASTGAIHVLAVSGLHVGIVFVILSFLLSFLGKSKTARFIRFAFVLLFIWFFAILTGAAPSVLRASLMFSFIALGQALNRRGSIYNSIFASAFILLLFNPFLLFDLSFQLSYSAVISILYFQPKIYALISVRFRVFKWIWALITVSLAAQIGTLPITIFYFHQFPNYFLLSNFIVIPLATLIIWLAVVFFMSLSFDFLAQFIADILQYIIAFQNALIREIEVLPYALTKDIYIDRYQLVLLVLILLSLMLLLVRPKFKYSLIMGLFLLSYFAYSDVLSYQKQVQKKLIVYDIKGSTAINLIDGKDNILISSLKTESKQKDYNLKQNWLSLGLDNEKYIWTQQLNSNFTISNLLKVNNPNFFLKDQFIQFYDKRILYLQDKSILSNYRKGKIPLDYIIIGKNTRIDIAELDLYFTAKTIIIDSSHSLRNLQFWKTQQAINPSKTIYLVSEEGAFVEDLELKSNLG